MKTNFPQVKVERCTIASASVGRVAIQKNSDEIITQQIPYFECFVNGNEAPELVSRFQHYSADENSDNLTGLSKAGFENILKQGKLTSILFQNPYVVYWQPFKALLSNIPKGLFEDGDSLFASFSGESIECLSHSRWCQTMKHAELFTICYTLNPKLLKAHVIKQLENVMLQHPRQPFLFACFVDTSLVDYTSKLLLNDLCLTNLKEDFEPYYSLFCVEKALV